MKNYIHFPADDGSPVTLVIAARCALVDVVKANSEPVAEAGVVDVRTKGTGPVNHRAFAVLSEMGRPVSELRGDVIFFAHKGQMEQARNIIKDAGKSNPWPGWDWVVLRDSHEDMEALEELTSRLTSAVEPDPLVQLLTEHQRVFGHRDGGLHCACGWVSSGAQGRQAANAVNQLSDFSELRHHVAAMIREGLATDILAVPTTAPEASRQLLPIPAAFALRADVAKVSPTRGITRGVITELSATVATVSFWTANKGLVHREFVVPKDHPGQSVLLVEWVGQSSEGEHGLILAPRPPVTAPAPQLH